MKSSKRYLYIIRHAKSDWSDVSLDDFERGLNKRGFRDSILIAKALRSKGVHFDYIVSSAAVRAKYTAEIIGAFNNYDIDRIDFQKSLYFATPQELIKTIQKSSNSIKSLALIGHNPELTELVNLISDCSLDNLPTSAVVALTFDKDWAQIEKGELLFYLSPKILKEKVTILS